MNNRISIKFASTWWSSDVSPIHNNNNNNGNASKNVNSGIVVIHLSNRPSNSTAAPTVNPESAKDFPSLGKKFNLDSDFVLLVPVNHNGISANHRSNLMASKHRCPKVSTAKGRMMQFCAKSSMYFVNLFLAAN